MSTVNTEWKAGGTAEASYAIWASHGGGIQYRLCPASSELNEDCFQQMPLAFATNHSLIRYTDGTTPDVEVPAVDASEGTSPVGSAWRRMPVPACNCDIGDSCKTSLIKKPGNMFLAYDDAGSDDVPNCPTGTQFEVPAPGIYGVGGYQCTGGATGRIPKDCDLNFEWSIVDELVVPDAPGDYVLSWRWDAEQTAQVWSTCADITIV